MEHGFVDADGAPRTDAGHSLPAAAHSYTRRPHMNESLLPAQRLAIARHAAAPRHYGLYRHALYRLLWSCGETASAGEDPAILGGVALFHGRARYGDRHPKGEDTGGKRPLPLRHAQPRGVPQGPAADAPGGEISPPRPHVHRYLRRLSRPGGGGNGDRERPLPETSLR